MSKKIEDRLNSFKELIDKSSINISDLNDDNYTKIIELCDSLPEYRKKHLIKYTISDLLIISILSIIKVGATSFLGMEEYDSSDIEYIKSLGLLKGDKIPSHDTFRRFSNFLAKTS